MKNLLAKTDEGLKSKKLYAEIRASNRKYADRKTRYTVQEWIESGINEASTSEKNDSRKQFGDTPDKVEGKNVRTMLQETPKLDCSNKEKRAYEATESGPIKMVQLEFPEKAWPMQLQISR